MARTDKKSSKAAPASKGAAAKKVAAAAKKAAPTKKAAAPAQKAPAKKAAAAKKAAPAKAAPAKAAPAKVAPAKAAPAKAAPPRVKPAPASSMGPMPKAKGKGGGSSATATARSVPELIAASEALDYQLVVLTSGGQTTYAEGADEIEIAPPTLFALTLASPASRRYVHLVQKAADSGQVVLLHVVDGAGATRVPAAPGWQRAVVEGTLHLLASDFLLTRDDIVAIIGGHEPPPTEARPPFI